MACEQQGDIHLSRQSVLDIVDTVGDLIFIDRSDLQHL